VTFADKLDPVAVYAATVSTTVLIWNIFVWFRNGPRLKVSASANMKTFGPGGRDDTTYLVANVRNVGTQQTTITHVVAFAYKNRWERFRGRKAQTFVVNHAVAAYPLPYVLPAGQTFMSMGEQTAELEKLSREKLLYLGVIHSCRERPLLARIRPIISRP
jgi:hypothetical protein